MLNHNHIARFFLAISCFLGSVLPFASHGQAFELKTYEQGISINVPVSIFGNGVSVYDFNQDGWDDITFCNNGQPAKFYVNNQGNLQGFNMVLGYIADGDIKHMVWVDYDNDGDKDLFITNYYQRNALLENDGNMVFNDVTNSSGLNFEEVQHYGCAWGDINNDGFLDLYVTKYHNQDFVEGYIYTNNLYLNDGDGTFTEIAMAAGVDDGVGPTFQAQFIDYNLDGWQDIFIINDRVDYSNKLFRNNGDTTFAEVSSATGMNLAFDAMCIAPADFDMDGDMDIFISNTTPGNYLMEKDGEFYTDVAADFGVEVGIICWGALWMDVDLDMDLDLYVANTGNIASIEYQNAFFENLDVFFLEDYEEFGLQDDVYGTYSVAMGDFNNDGWPDFAQGNNYPSDNHVYYNTGTGTNHWAKISVEGTISNRDGIGTWVKLYAGGVEQIRYTYCGENYLSQNSQRLMFGLDNFTMIDSVEVTWLSGLVENYYDLPADTTYHFIEGQSLTNQITALGPTDLCVGETVILDAGLYESYEWSSGDTTQTIEIGESGSFSVTVIDEFGFEITSDTVFVEVVDNVEILAEVGHVYCQGDSTGTITAMVDDDIIVQSVSWTNGDTELTSDSLAAGEYSITILHTNECISSESFIVEDGPPMSIAVFWEDVLCFDDSTGAMWAIPAGGTPPLTLNWGGQSTQNIPAGEYWVSVTDSNMCTVDSLIIISQPDALTLDLDYTDITDNTDGSATIGISGGIEPYNILWSNGDTTLTSEPLDIGDFNVVVTDANGCSESISFIITGLHILENTPVTIYPNPAKDVLNIVLENGMNSDAIFRSDRGETVRIFQLTPGLNTIDLHSLAAGAYLVEIQVDDLPHVFKIIKLE